MDDTLARIAEARNRLEIALAAEEEAWGPTDGHNAKPQAVQLQMRIHEGERYVKEHPKEQTAKVALLQLRSRYAQALEDPEDQERCREWEASYREFLEAEREYLDLVREARAMGLEAET